MEDLSQFMEPNVKVNKTALSSVMQGESKVRSSKFILHKDNLGTHDL
ncbi:MAG: hypothetical protein WBA07_06855 [Rivularia sp. (in: cyanobacteria)]